jgi:DNA-3-methyladenine glycosylase II
MSLPAYWQQSKEFLMHADPKLAKLILEHQQYSISSRGEALETLLRSIVGQQISVQAAASVWGKLEKKNWQNKTRKCNFDELRRT